MGFSRQEYWSGVPLPSPAVQVGHSFSSKEQVSFNFMLQSPSAVILEPKKIKSVTVSIVSLSICHEVMGRDALILFF